MSSRTSGTWLDSKWDLKAAGESPGFRQPKINTVNGILAECAGLSWGLLDFPWVNPHSTMVLKKTLQVAIGILRDLIDVSMYYLALTSVQSMLFWFYMGSKACLKKGCSAYFRAAAGSSDSEMHSLQVLLK